jgi:nitrogen fixation protein FixH
MTMRTNSDVTLLQDEGLQGRHVLMILLGFFGVIFAVNGFFLVSALSTHTGVVASEPYRKGLEYNDRIAADERQALLGWRESLSVETSGAIALTLHDANGAPIPNLAVTAILGRPATARFDRRLALVESERGQYTATARALEGGSWIASIEVRTSTSDGLVFQSRRRLWLKP